MPVSVMPFACATRFFRKGDLLLAMVAELFVRGAQSELSHRLAIQTYSLSRKQLFLCKASKVASCGALLHFTLSFSQSHLAFFYILPM